MIELLDDVERFAQRAGPLLEGTVDNTVLATVLDALRGHPFDPPPHFALVVDERGAVVGAALRTPPRGLLCTTLTATDAEALIAAWLEHDPELPGLNAPTVTADALAAAWSDRIGVRLTPHMRMALHAVAPSALHDPPRPAAGVLRRPESDERDLVVAWEQAFADEGGIGVRPEQTARLAEVRMAAGRTFVWDDDGTAVSLVGHTVAIARVPRIGPVYTPPALRRRGYAGSAVAAVSRRLLAAGAREVVLFTDLANPTSNKIYAELGYRRIGDWALYER